jgi:hypothetical protein
MIIFNARRHENIQMKAEYLCFCSALNNLFKDVVIFVNGYTGKLLLLSYIHENVGFLPRFANKLFQLAAKICSGKIWKI